LLRALPWLALLVGAALSVAIWQISNERMEDRARGEFEHHVDRFVESIHRRMVANEQALRSIEGLFNASTNVSRDEFRRFVSALHVDRHYPGIQGIGFARMIPAQALGAHVRTVQGEGFPEYRVMPPGSREFYTAIDYLEPFDWRNRRAFGYDMFSEPVRRAAMARARDTGMAALSGRVTLLQETDRDVQAGTLLYIPIYSRDAHDMDTAGRRAHLVGWAYSPLRMRDWAQSLLQQEHAHLVGRIAFRIHDGTVAEPGALLFETDTGVAAGVGTVSLVRRITLAGQAWTVTAQALPTFHPGHVATSERSLLIAELVISWLGALLAASLIRNQLRARAGLRGLTAANRELERERKRLQSVFDASSVAIFFVDAQGVITIGNQRMAEMFGCSVGQLHGAEYVSLIHPSEREIGRRKMLALLGSNIDQVDLERKYWRADHTEFWGHLTGRRLAEVDGEGVGLIGVIADITPRRQAEQALRESEARFRMIAENSNDVIWLMDLASRRFTYVSPSVERMRGWTPQEILAQSIDQSLTPDSLARVRPALVERLRRLATGDESVRFAVTELDQPCKDGRVIKTEVVSTILIDDNGQASQLLGITRDITERKRAEAELERYRDHLEELVASRTAELAAARDAAEAASRAKSVFLANMSHELRTPLNGIMGMTGLALRRTSEPRMVDQLNRSMESARHLLALIENILDIANFEAGRVVLVEAPFSLAQVVDDVLRMHDSVAWEKHIDLAAEIAPDVPQELIGDAARLRQILINLVGNAVKFSERGTVRIRVDGQAEDEGGVFCLSFEVEDQGIGLDPENQAKLFQLFSQGDDGATRAYGGTGLGLVIARRIARLMGGDIAVCDTPGPGSCFRVTVCLRRA